MYTGMLHTHTLIVILYLIMLIIKTGVLFFGSREALARVRKKTKILEMILPTLFIITGIYLWTQSAATDSLWFAIKIILVLLVVFTGLRAFRTRSKLLGAVTLILFIYVYGISETKSLNFKKDLAHLYGAENVEEREFDASAPDYNQIAHGKYLFNRYCMNCHGPEGDLQRSGAKDLSDSELPVEGIEEVIMEGKKTMPPYGEVLDEKEISALTAFVIKFRE